MERDIVGGLLLLSIIVVPFIGSLLALWFDTLPDRVYKLKTEGWPWDKAMRYFDKWQKRMEMARKGENPELLDYEGFFPTERPAAKEGENGS